MRAGQQTTYLTYVSCGKTFTQILKVESYMNLKLTIPCGKFYQVGTLIANVLYLQLKSILNFITISSVDKLKAESSAPLCFLCILTCMNYLHLRTVYMYYWAACIINGFCLLIIQRLLLTPLDLSKVHYTLQNNMLTNGDNSTFQIKVFLWTSTNSHKFNFYSSAIIYPIAMTLFILPVYCRLM